MTKVRVLDVRVLAAKDRGPDDPPGAQLLLQATLSSDVLSMFDGFLPGMLFRKGGAKQQGKLDGIEGSELTSIGDHVKRLAWQYEQTGCEIVIDHGTGGRSNIPLSDCKAHRVLISPREGGSVVVQWSIDAPGLTDATRGKLTGMKATDIQMTMVGPEVQEDGQQSIDDKPPAKVKGAKAAKAAEAPPKDGAWPFGDKGDKNAPNAGKTPEQALAETQP
jgi:hypothetical protein